MAASPEAGLCASCLHARRQRSARGSSFWRCALAESDPGFLRYPPLPVLRCEGYAKAPSDPPRTGADPDRG